MTALQHSNTPTLKHEIHRYPPPRRQNRHRIHRPPPEVVTGLGKGKKPAVKVTINGHTYRTSIAVMGGDFMLGVSAEQRANTGIKGGDVVEVEVELDTEPRVVNVPQDLNEALDKDPEARKFFDTLSYSNKLRHVLAIDGAKTEETRQRRIEKSVALFHDHKV